MKEIGESNRMGKTRYLFKKIIKRIFHANMDTKNDRKIKALTEEEDTKERWQEYTELYKKVFSQFSSVAQLYWTLHDPMDCSTPGLHVHHQPPELAQTHVH